MRVVQLADGPPQMSPGKVVLVENIRFDPRETSKDEAERGALADELAALVGGRTEARFVSDGFGVVHRKQASVYDVAKRLPAYAGGLVLSEVEVLRELTGSPERPYAVVLGGSKVSDKLAVIDALLPRVDALLVGGGMCFTFLAAQGYGVGKSLLETDQIGTCRTLLESGKIVLPTDVVVADAFAADAATQTVAVDAIPDGCWVWTSARIRSPRSPRCSGGRRPSSGTGRWACSRWPRSPRAPAAWRRRSSTHDEQGSVLRGRRRRLRGRRARARPRRRRLLAHLDRRRRVVGVPGGQRPSRRGHLGVLTWVASR